MSGFMTTNTDHLIRSNLWSGRLKEKFQEELSAQKYVDWLTEFPDGDTWNIPSIGDPEVLNYEEGQAIRYTAMDTGNFTFSITEYKQSATFITEKMKQDSFWANQIVGKFVPKQHRALMEIMETDVLNIGVGGQTANDPNVINTARHRFVAGGTSQEIVPEDFAKAKYALQKANVPMTNLVAIVDPSVEYNLSTMTNLVNLSNNPRWDGIVRDGMSTGMRFITNVFGFDVYTSNFLPKNLTETISSTAITGGVASIFFSAAPDALPFMGAVRQEPKVDSEFNKDLQREEYVTTSRYGFKLYRPENLVTVLSNPAVTY
jgi:hypothetical protein